jgi:hypothetical protein
MQRPGLRPWQGWRTILPLLLVVELKLKLELPLG